jgi:DNA-binding response OmpR family regulator
MNPHLLIIDDDCEFSQMLSDYLELEGFQTTQMYDGETGIAQIRAQHFDMVVLDIMLPGMNGIDVLKQIRQDYAIPILMLTAKGEDIDRVVGLELGADDYLPKPCNPRELVARIRAILRRTQAPPKTHRNPIKVGYLQLNVAERLAIWHHYPLELTSSEFNILHILAANVGTVISKKELSERALGKDLKRYDRNIDMHISNLRQKLGCLPQNRSPIQTIRGIGYQFIATNNAAET